MQIVMRFPLKSEGDAFRMTVALGLAAGSAVLVGWLASPKYGIVMLAAGLAAGLVFEFAGRDAARGSPLRDASHAEHPHGASEGTSHVLVVATTELAGEELCRELTVRGGGVELDVLAPILASRSHYWSSDVDREREDARKRLERSLAWAAAHGFTAKGEIGDPDALAAIEDELRDFGADEVIIAMPPGEHQSWLANRMLEHLARELDVPVRDVIVDEGSAPLGP